MEHNWARPGAGEEARSQARAAWKKRTPGASFARPLVHPASSPKGLEGRALSRGRERRYEPSLHVGAGRDRQKPDKHCMSLPHCTSGAQEKREEGFVRKGERC